MHYSIKISIYVPNAILLNSEELFRQLGYSNIDAREGGKVYIMETMDEAREYESKYCGIEVRLQKVI